MGLLTDPSAGQGKVVKLLLRYYAKLCVVLYVVGVVYFCLLASPQLNSGTYFSENALLPGLVISEFKNDNMARLFHEELNDEMKKYDDSIPYPWLLAKFRQIGLDTYTQNFTLDYPLGRPQKYEGKNVYAILRAPRAASTESLVLSVPYRPPSSVHPPTTASIAIMLAFAKFAIKEKYWAKDIIFLITEHEQLGIQAWLEAYHGVSCGRKNTLFSGDMKGRAGAIQAAINLEFHDVEIGQIDLKIEGLNGQVPNLDLFNLAARMCSKEGLQLTFKNRVSERIRNSFKEKKISVLFREWSYNFKTLMGMVATQATGAITMEGFAPSTHKMSRGGFYTMGRILEGTFRSLNNLLERFHQSFFFYLLPSAERYISIGLYIPAICLLVATLFIKSYAKWCQLHENFLIENLNEQGDQEMKKKTIDVEKVKKIKEMHDKMTLDDWKKKFDEECKKGTSSKNSISLGHICLVFVMSHILGVTLKDSPKYISQIAVAFGYSTDQAIFAVFVAVFLITLPFPLFVRKPCYRSMAFLNILSLIELGTTLICVSMYNISLGMFLATLYVPLALLINPGNCRFCNRVQKVLWIFVHPLVILSVTVLVSSFLMFPGEKLLEVLYRSLDATQKALTFSIVDSMIYGNWLFNVVTCIFVSNWFCFWYVTFSEPNLAVETSDEKKTN